MELKFEGFAADEGKVNMNVKGWELEAHCWEIGFLVSLPDPATRALACRVLFGFQDDFIQKVDERDEFIFSRQKTQVLIGDFVVASSPEYRLGFFLQHYMPRDLSTQTSS